jgi:hypothetical protein
MDDNFIKAVLAIAGAIAGGLIASAANAYAARQKIREVEISYAYKLRDGYLENARKMAAEVYIPINIALHNCPRLMTTFEDKSILTKILRQSQQKARLLADAKLTY